jgi:hypothetical protein
VLNTKKRYTYTDSDGSDFSYSSVPPPPHSATAGPATTSIAPHVTPPAKTTALVNEALLMKYDEDALDDLLQACLSDLPADAEGISAWFERKIALTAEDRKALLQVESPAPLATDKIMRRMRPNMVTRLELLLQYLERDAPV